MSLTIRQVAKRLKLSITTVSRALDDYPDVAADTRAKVRRVAAEMGYTPSRAARALRRQRADAMGFILSTQTPRFADPFFSEFVSGLADGAATHKLELILAVAPAGSTEELEIYRRWVQSRRVDGIVLGRTRLKDERVRLLADAAFPFVAFGRTRQRLTFPYIDVDNEAGMRQLTAHLLAQGHRRIGFIGGPPEFMFQALRLAGYRAAHEAAAVPVEEALVLTADLTRQGGRAAAQQLLVLPSPPTALIGVNDLTAIGALLAAQALNLPIGRGLAIAGFDGLAEAEHLQPPLTTVRQPIYEIAQRLTHTLMALINHEPLTPSRLILPPELMLRASTGD